MPRVTTSRRIAALLTAALVSVLLVAVGGAARSTTHRTTVSGSHDTVGTTAARAKQAVPVHNSQQYLPLDLATPPTDSASPAGGRTHVVSAAPASRIERDLATPTGRAPPAL